MQMKAEEARWNIFYLMVSVFFFFLSIHYLLCIYRRAGVLNSSCFVTLQSLGNKYSGITTADTLPQVFAHLFMQLHSL